MKYYSTLLLGLAVACGDDAREPASHVDDDERAPQPFVDLNPDPGVVEVRLAASPGEVEYLAGKPAAVWAYRDAGRADALPTIPGPVLEAKVGDQIIVHFVNELTEETTIHWHGLRVPASQDGALVSQAPVPPGGTFDYAFTALDAGFFWYHPHMHSDVQIERGLYGLIVLRDAFSVPVHEERLLVLDDVKLSADGALDEDTTHMDLMMGRQGNVLLANGQVLPELHTRPGSRERWRLLNSANGRTFNLSLPGLTFLVIGWDGGLLPEPYEAETLLVAPGERYDVVIEVPGDAQDVELVTLSHDSGHHMTTTSSQPLLALVSRGDAAAPIDALPSTWRALEPIDVAAATTLRTLALSEDMMGLRFFINGFAWPEHEHITAATDSVEVWAIDNRSGMDHPFHLHGTFFQVLDSDGVPADSLGWKDTVIVPRSATVRLAIRFDNPGAWMYHCHILEHAERGMMGQVDVQ